ncbi:MAG: outer membrane protein assembly factor BamD [Holosporales bacterium]|jgi:outer membrane protein assembly factor BamD|nr:outer membrane protein assembly factor BamD [Holosporales bacterium]
MRYCCNLALFLAIFLAGCSSDIDLKKFENKEADSIYKEACSHIDKRDYSFASKIFEELEKLHPYSKYAALAQVKLGDCYYKMKKYEEAASEYEIFVKTHSTHELVPYAIYMLGIVYYEQMPIIERDQEVTIKALQYLYVLQRKFKSSKYVKDANKIVKELRQHLAGREVYVATYYQKHNNFAAAVNRLNTVIDIYGNTDHAPEAMHRLVECYVAMGFFDEARKVNSILQKKFSKTNWAIHSKNLLLSVKK